MDTGMTRNMWCSCHLLFHARTCGRSSSLSTEVTPQNLGISASPLPPAVAAGVGLAKIVRGITGPVSTVLRAFMLLLGLSLASACTPERTAAVSNAEAMSACVDRLAAKAQEGRKVTEALWDAANLCQTMITVQQANEQQRIKADNFIFQRGENVVLMWMVVAITLAGVALAAAQLLASYLLAKAGRGALAEGGSIDLSKDKLAVQSSVVGVIVLAISFAFFLVFVLYVYTFQEPDQSRGGKPQAPIAAARPVAEGPFQPSGQEQAPPSPPVASSPATK
jgi:hypothetical protein